MMTGIAVIGVVGFSLSSSFGLRSREVMTGMMTLVPSINGFTEIQSSEYRSWSNSGSGKTNSKHDYH